ncbi:hypothetical protein RHMOL_Rhmol01G0037700 [Rhododendron molle]|uniref:Uncharacterized protein n=1 Tax=Rhododendron molle TaxID=49168 RepID=A0ACC0PXM1_RHOML|nr:hypothetical protein RHMOL_Rhmol01G0037700 [Rhododendron molle]
MYIFQIIKHLISNLEVDVNARNGSGWTALEIHSQVATSLDPNSVDHDRIKVLLSEAGAKRCSELLIPFDPSWQKKKKSTLMIVSSLMATMTFQVGVNPPGGIWQDSSESHIAGTAIIASTRVADSFPVLMYFNTVAFLLCLTTIFDLIVVLPADKQDSKFAQSGFLRFWFSWLTITTMVFVYTFSVVVITPDDTQSFFTEAIILTAMVWCILVSFMGGAPLKVRLATGVVTVVIAILIAGLTGYFEGARSAMLFFAVTLAVAGVLLLMIYKRRIVEIPLQRWLRRPQIPPQHQSEMQLARMTPV